MATLVLDDDSQADAVAAVVHRADPRAELVLPAFVAREGMDDLLAEIRRFGLFALLGIALVAALVYRSPRRVLAACLPCGLGVLWTAAALVLTGTAWNAVSAAAMVLLVGLSLDYGVFQLDAVERGNAGPAGRGMLLNGLANMAGFGTLVLSRSPGLFGLGLAVLVGLGTSLLVTFSLVPALALGQPLLPPAFTRWLRPTSPGAPPPPGPSA
jgi:predicted RND superfamily exporter protein